MRYNGMKCTVYVRTFSYMSSLQNISDHTTFTVDRKLISFSLTLTLIDLELLSKF